jgi:hypothetical protein
MVPNNLVQIDEEIQIDRFNLKIGSFSLCGLRFLEEVFITETDGLQVIGIRPDWLKNLDLTHKKKRLLKEKGFSFQVEHFYYGLEDNAIEVVRPWSDWPIVWEYFCNKGNAKAASLLRHLATHALESFLY